MKNNNNKKNNIIYYYMDKYIYIIIVIIVIYLFSNNKKNNVLEKFTQLSGYNNIILSNENRDLQSIQFPTGIIVLWSGQITNIPKGWSLCDSITKNGITAKNNQKIFFDYF